MVARGLYWTLHLLIWAGFFYVLAPVWGGAYFQLDPLFTEEETLPFFAYGFAQNALLFYAYVHLGLPAYLRSQSSVHFMVLNAAYLVGFVLLESTLDYFYTRHVHLLRGSDAWRSWEDWLMTNLTVNGAFLLLANFYGFTYEWFRDQSRRSEMAQEKLRAELSALKHQIHPHFLFNILNSLYGLAFRNNDEPTAEGIAKLSQMMRYMLYESNEDRVSLAREIEYIESYIALQKIRINDATQVRFSVSAGKNDAQIAPMLLISFVENAFKHGISSVRPSEIEVRLALEENRLHFYVENPIHQVAYAGDSAPGGIGLQNVKKRLDLLYTGAYLLEVDSSGGRYRVDLMIEL
jgi:signal transduction histidine kinase